MVDVTVIATLLPFEEREHLDVEGVHVLDLDVTSQKQVDDFCGRVDAISDRRLDFLFNNASVSHWTRLTSLTHEITEGSYTQCRLWMPT